MAQNRPESLVSILKALGEFVLIVFGLIGISVEVFHEQGLLKKLLNTIMNAAMASSMLMIVGILVALAMLKIWYDSVFSTAENAHALGDFLMKAMMAAGVFYVYVFLTTGGFKL